MMDIYARIVQGEYPAVIIRLGVANPGRIDHIPVKETCRRFETSSDLKLALEISYAAARTPLQSGKEDRALHRKPNRQIEAHVLQNLERMMLKEAAIWAWDDLAVRIHFELCFKCLLH